MKRVASMLLLFVVFLVDTICYGSNTLGPLASTTNPTQMAHNADTIHDIRGPIALADTPMYYLGVAAIVLGIVLVIFLLYFYFTRRKKTQASAPSSWEVALRELGEARSLCKPDSSLLYMEKAAEILRRYIEARFLLPSTRQTTAEFLMFLEGTGNKEFFPYKEKLQYCLEQADLAKFAHVVPDTGDLEKMESMIRAFIESTVPKTDPEENA